MRFKIRLTWEKIDSSLLLEFCIFKKRECGMFGNKKRSLGIEVCEEEKMSRPAMTGSSTKRKTRWPHQSGHASICGFHPTLWLVLYGILFYSLRARMEKQELALIQDPGLTHMSWRKFKWGTREWWQAVLPGWLQAQGWARSQGRQKLTESVGASAFACSSYPMRPL